MDGFSVDLDALAAAGDGIAGLVALLDAQSVADIDCDRAAVGHHRLAEALASFCDRWQVGVTSLAEDGAEMARRLRDTVASYQADEEALGQTLRGPAGNG